METLVVGQMSTNCYIVDGMIIDPGDDAEYIMDHVKNPKMIVATHGHFDHIMAAYALQKTYNIPFYIHPDDIFLLQTMQSSARHFLGIRDVDPPPAPTPIPKTIQYIHTPGHTPGSICLVGRGIIFTGDTLFADGSVGRADFSYSDADQLATSVARIKEYNRHHIYAGHSVE